MGVAAAKDGDDTQTLVQRAERGLQRAIVEGGNRLVIEYE
jgi:hypothetical protein